MRATIDIPAELARAGDAAKEVVRNGGFVAGFARFGFTAKGVTYLLIGTLAAMAALGGAGGRTAGTSGALQGLMDRPLGWVLVGLIALGFAAFAAWEFIRAVEDPQHAGSDAKGLAIRSGQLLGGIIQFALAIFVGSIAIGWHTVRDPTGDRPARDWTRYLMSYPKGRVLVV